jgi:hypothetical protein
LLAKRSCHQESGAHFGRAVEMLQEMDMKFWLKFASDYRISHAER